MANEAEGHRSSINALVIVYLLRGQITVPRCKILLADAKVKASIAPVEGGIRFLLPMRGGWTVAVHGLKDEWH